MPSKWYEGFPNVITRAMRHGKPVITTNIGAMQSIIENNVNGILVKPGDSVDLTRAIEDLYYDEHKCKDLGEQGKKYAKKLYNGKAVYKELMNAYNYTFNVTN